jgi:glycosyltransferase involved in cell wall biosynthesis
MNDAALRIAEVAPLFTAVPPPRYGGTERVVHALTEELVRRGHRVTLFAAGGSRTAAELHECCPRPLWEMPRDDPLAYRALQVEELVRRSGEFDVVHSHVEYLPWLAGERLRAPIVTTLHGRLDLSGLRAIFEAARGWPLVSISDAQRRPVEDLSLNWVATVHHGLDLASTYSLGSGDGGYLVFLGRIAPDKDPVTAIRVAIRSGLPLKIAARVDPSDAEFFQRFVKPWLDHPLVEWIGQQDDRSKDELLGGARALLLPVDWDEPFGLTFIEALATGTPVISRPRGSLPEIVRHGEHGFLVHAEDEMVRACRMAGELDRAACRRWALERFSVKRMADGYERVFREVAGAEEREPQPSEAIPA